MKEYINNHNNSQKSAVFAGARTTGAPRGRAYLTKTNICTTTPVDLSSFLAEIDHNIKLFSLFISRTRQFLIEYGGIYE